MATDFFLNIETIQGESKDSAFTNQIDVLAWSWGESQTGSQAYGGGGGAGKVSMQDFSFSMHLNKASPKLALACATGQHITKAVLTCRRAGGKQQPYLKVTLSDVLVSSYQTGGSGGSDELPIESVTLNFAKIEQEYLIQDEKGATASAGKFTYDLKQNKAG